MVVELTKLYGYSPSQTPRKRGGAGKVCKDHAMLRDNIIAMQNTNLMYIPRTANVSSVFVGFVELVQSLRGTPQSQHQSQHHHSSPLHGGNNQIKQCQTHS